MSTNGDIFHEIVFLLLVSLLPCPYLTHHSLSCVFSQRTDARGLPQVTRVSQGSSGTVITLVSMAVVGGVLVLAMAVACLRHYTQQVANGKLGLGPEGGAETHFDYQVREHKETQD